MEKILGSLLSLYRYYSILLLLIIIPLILLVLITTTPPDPLPLFSTLTLITITLQKSLLFSLSFSLFLFSVSALLTDSFFTTLCDFLFPYLFPLFLSILSWRGEDWFSDYLPVSSKFPLGIFSYSNRLETCYMCFSD